MAAKQRSTLTDDAPPPAVVEDGVFRLQDFLPYEFSFIANRVSSLLAAMYQERFKLSVNGWRVLAVLSERSPLSAKQVGEFISMNAVNVTRAVAQLDELGLVKRSTNSEDYRQVMLSPTRKGQAVYREVVPLAVRIEQELLKDLEPQELAMLRAVMARLSQSAATRLSGDWRALLDRPPSP